MSLSCHTGKMLNAVKKPQKVQAAPMEPDIKPQTDIIHSRRHDNSRVLGAIKNGCASQ